MGTKAAITVNRPRAELEQLWASSPHRPDGLDNATVRFKDAPGDRGTEIHVELHDGPPGGKLGEAVQGIIGSPALPKLKDGLRRFKQHVETGEIPRSDATPEGESAERKFKQRPAQPLDESELQKVGAR